MHDRIRLVLDEGPRQAGCIEDVAVHEMVPNAPKSDVR